MNQTTAFDLKQSQNRELEDALSVIQALQLENDALRKQCQEQQKLLAKTNEELSRTQSRQNYIESNYELIVNSHGHRLLKKYYKLREQGLRSAIAELLGKPPKRSEPDMYSARLTIRYCKQINILSAPSHDSLAQLLQSILQEAGIACEITWQEQKHYPEVPYIVIDTLQYRYLPELYIVYRTAPFGEALLEQEDSEYIRYLSNAFAVFDYSLNNINFLSKIKKLSKKLYYMPSDSLEQLTADPTEQTCSVNPTAFYLNRFLLANDRITFDQFYDAVSDYVTFSGDRLCLSLPETTERRAEFDADNHYGFEVFPGLKHHMGWVGCGLSYKFIFKKIIEKNLETVLICEDDTFFPPDFEERFQKVLDYTATHHDWNIFNGIISDIGDAKLIDLVEENEESFAYVDRMISTVFNLYHKSIFEAISNWDPTNHDVETNTIDRYLHAEPRRVLTLVPFIVGHKEDMLSTLWDSQNTIYTDKIANSGQRLLDLIEEFRNRKL